MFISIRNRIRDLVRAESVVISIHASEEMDADSISSADVVTILLNGDIIERQRDRITGEWKYLFSGLSVGLQMIVVVKISINNRVFIITVFSL